MEKRRLGRTGHNSTVVTFGTAGIGRVSQPVADTAVEQILAHGVNHVDIAPSYGEAMERLAPWMPKIRDRVFLGAKSAGTKPLSRLAEHRELHAEARRGVFRPVPTSFGRNDG